MKQSLSLIHRSLSAIAGLFIGALLGMLGLYLLMIILGTDFGMDSVRPGMALGAILGFFFGLSRPWRWWFRHVAAPRRVPRRPR